MTVPGKGTRRMQTIGDQGTPLRRLRRQSPDGIGQLRGTFRVLQKQGIAAVRYKITDSSTPANDNLQSTGHGFKYRQIEGVLKGRRDQAIGCSVENSDVPDGREKLHAVIEAQALDLCKEW